MRPIYTGMGGPSQLRSEPSSMTDAEVAFFGGKGV